MSSNHESFIRVCIQIAISTYESGNPPFGALLTFGNEILLKAMNTQVTDDDFSSHAEFKLVSEAAREIQADVLTKSTIYCSNEPCPMCVGAIYWSGIRRVVFGCSSDTLSEIRGFGWPIKCKDIFHKATDYVDVIGPMKEEEIVPMLKRYYVDG